MWVIGTDGGYLDAPVKIDPALGQKLVIMPGERYDVIIDFADTTNNPTPSGTYILRNTGRTPFPKHTTQAIYSRMCFVGSLVKLGPQPQQTALEYGARLNTAFPQQAEAIANIVQGYTLSQYSREKALEAIQARRMQESGTGYATLCLSAYSI